MIDDFLHISASAKENGNSGRGSSSSLLEKGSFNIYANRPKRELLEEYERRILRNV